MCVCVVIDLCCSIVSECTTESRTGLHCILGLPLLRHLTLIAQTVGYRCHADEEHSHDVILYFLCLYDDTRSCTPIVLLRHRLPDPDQQDYDTGRAAM